MYQENNTMKTIMKKINSQENKQTTKNKDNNKRQQITLSVLYLIHESFHHEYDSSQKNKLIFKV